MISIDFVNGTRSIETEFLFRPYESFFESYLDNINKDYYKLSIMEDKIMLESSIMGHAKDSHMMIYESEKKSFFQRIGEAVITIYNKIKEFVETIIEKLKSISFSRKNDLQKLDMLIKKHPELKNEVIDSFNSGALNPSDIKSLKELDKTFDEILKMSRQKDIDPKSLRGRWEKAKKKFDESEKSWKIVKVASATAVIITAVVAVATLTKKIHEAKLFNQDYKQKTAVEKAKIVHDLKTAEENADAGISNDTGIYETELAIWNQKRMCYTAVMKENLTAIERLQLNIARFLDKHTSDKKKERYHKNMDQIYERNKAAEKKSVEEEFNRAYASSWAQNAAREDYKDNQRNRNNPYANTP